MTTIGIPFAFTCTECFAGAICPACGAHITLTERKDFESFTKREYAAHWATEHEGRLTIGSERIPRSEKPVYRSIVVDISAEGHDGVGKRVGLSFDRAPDGCPVADR